MSDPHAFTCAQCQQQLEEFALDELPEVAGEQVAKHLATGCESCNHRLVELLGAWSAAAHLLPPQLPPLQIERDLMSRVRGKQPSISPTAETSTRAQRDPPTVESNTNPRLIAVLALAASLLGVAVWIAAGGDHFGKFSAELAEEAAFRSELQRRAEQADRLQHLSVPHLNFKYVRNQAPAKPIHGYIVSDELSHQWHIYTFNLPPLAEGRKYALWLVSTDNKFIAAGPLEVDSDGTSSKLIDLTDDVSIFNAIAISEESAAGSTEPGRDVFVTADLP
jgi:hypothetical protein